jgi:hypothetical protein
MGAIKSWTVSNELWKRVEPLIPKHKGKKLGSELDIGQKFINALSLIKFSNGKPFNRDPLYTLITAESP